MGRRLDEALANAGIGSRRDARALILTGHVFLNGRETRKIDTRVESTDTVTVNGEPVDLSEFIYLMMNKPCGYVSSTEGADSLLCLVPDAWKRKDLFPVGRLDKDTSGLILITNDGAFAHRVTSPSGKIEKTYVATLDHPADDATVRAFREGMTLRDGLTTKPAALVCDGTTAEVTLSEGKYHEVRRMFAACGNYVKALRRIRVGALTLDVPEGETRRLTEDEILLFG